MNPEVVREERDAPASFRTRPAFRGPSEKCVKVAFLPEVFPEDAVHDHLGHVRILQAVQAAELASLQTTFCPMERDAMLRAALDIVRFFREHAPRVAEASGSDYPVELERLMSDRLDRLAASL